MMSKRGLATTAGLCLLLALLPACPAGLLPTWMINIGDEADEGAEAVVRMDDGGLVVAGYVESEEDEDANAVLMRLGPQGRTIWRVEYGDEREDSALAVAKAQDGGFVIAGQFGSYNEESSDGFLIKTDAEGTEQWRRLFDSGGHDFASSVEATADGGYLVGVQYDLYADSTAAIVKTDANGETQWEAEAGVGTNLAGATVGADGTYALAWWQVVPSELLGVLNGRVGIAKYNTDGSEASNVSHDIPALAEVKDVQGTADGGFVLTGQYDLMAGDSQAMLWKTDSAGQLVWQKTYSLGLRDIVHAVCPTRDGGYVLAGGVQPANGHSNILLLKTSASGDLQWERAYGGNDYDEGFDVVETNIGYAVVGTGESFEARGEVDNSQIIVLKTDRQGRSPRGEVELPEP